MAKKRVLIMVDEDLNDRWKKVAKRLKFSKSGMITDILEEVLPILEKEKPNDMIGSALKSLGDALNDTGSLFDEKENN